MSSLSKALVFAIEEISDHPNADALEVVHPFGCPAIVKKGEYAVGQYAIFIPFDMVVPTDRPEFAFLGDRSRIKSTKLRGQISMGIVIPAKSHHTVGQDVTEEYGITKYEPKVEKSTFSNAATPPPVEFKYTDIENLRKYHKLLLQGEKVIMTEKLHGASARFTYQDGKLHVGSRKQWVQDDQQNIWSRLAHEYDLHEKLKPYEGWIFFGEAYGHVQDLRYNHGVGEISLSLFDIMPFIPNSGSYFLDYERFLDKAHELELPVITEFYKGPWLGLDWSLQFAEGKSLYGDNVREGFVVRPVNERWHDSCGRLILKLHGEGFLTRRKNA